MTLQQIREQLIKQTGRYDLVSDRVAGSYADNGANYFIQAGQRFLDRQLNHKSQVMTFQKDFASGSHMVELLYLYSINTIWAISNSTQERSRLIRKTHDWLREHYPDPIADTDQGEPLYYAPVSIVLSPEQKALTSSDYSDTFTYDYEGIAFADELANPWIYRGIKIMPPLDESYTIVVEGRFASLLSADTDRSYWTEKEPELSVLAAMLSIEMHYRNTSGVNDIRNSINELLHAVSTEETYEEVVDVVEMEG